MPTSWLDRLEAAARAGHDYRALLVEVGYAWTEYERWVVRAADTQADMGWTDEEMSAEQASVRERFYKVMAAVKTAGFG
jgi:hypothetical protein